MPGSGIPGHGETHWLLYFLPWMHISLTLKKNGGRVWKAIVMSWLWPQISQLKKKSRAWKATQRMGGNICQSYIWEGIQIQNIQPVYRLRKTNQTHNPIRQWAEVLKRRSSKRDLPMTDAPMKRRSTSFVLLEMMIETSKSRRLWELPWPSALENGGGDKKEIRAWRALVRWGPWERVLPRVRSPRWYWGSATMCGLRANWHPSILNIPFY